MKYDKFRYIISRDALFNLRSLISGLYILLTPKCVKIQLLLAYTLFDLVFEFSHTRELHKVASKIGWKLTLTGFVPFLQHYWTVYDPDSVFKTPPFQKQKRFYFL